MIFWRLLLGAVIVVVALWIIVGEQITGASADATINAQLSMLRAPIAGDLSISQRKLGSIVSEGEVLATVTDPLADGVRRDDLVMELALAEASVSRLALLRDGTATIAAALESRSRTYRTARIEEIGTRLRFARERLEILRDDAFPTAFDIAPPQDGGVERAGAAEAEGLRRLWINAVSERIAALEIELATAREGVFVGDSYNDAPNAEQRLSQLRSEQAAVTAQLREAEAGRDAIAARLDAERLRVNTARLAQIEATARGRIWEALASDGESVQRGDPVIRLLDCASVFVTASVTESVYNDLAFGQRAVFRPSGGGRAYDATVMRRAGAGAETVYRNLAVAPSAQHLQRYDVALLVPGLLADETFACAVGRTGRVFFDRRPLDWIRGFWN
ncbi:HlyD family efflux transporter periplasmic adaptor subunit [Jannaschia sp. W003]|uniref:HlyD family efflux transporter periplasmic adaptor subunit n=1 Tax=Jannaschia sp. W003 TaxID=2867012 RepID=UPI0021A7286F|nr:HlyD family efflux transporter periplasmic adaptor subunit [Jannaschia sp. W003]UWQ23159.1 HlyD family efflux transporter periplasmic adaptor subunit [Jannaschia sp. W003]